MRRLRLNGPLVAGATVVLGLVVILLLPLFIDLDPNTVRLTDVVNGRIVVPPLAPGVNGHLLGTDRMGRDLLARLVYGARFTLSAGFGIAALRALLGIPLGLIAGWYGGTLSYITNLLSSSLSALPTLLAVIVLMHGAALAVKSYNSYLAAYVVVVALVGVPRLAEQLRRLVDEVKTQPYIEAARATGAPTARIVVRHILRVISGDLVVALAAETGWVLLLMGQLAVFRFIIAGDLAFQGGQAQGVSAEKTAEWAEMVGLNYGLFRTRYWVPLYPVLALGTTVAGLQLLAEGLRRRWLHR